MVFDDFCTGARFRHACAGVPRSRAKRGVGATCLLADGAADDLSVPEKVFRSRANVFDDLAEQEGGDIASAVHRNGRPSTVRVPKLLV
jgi:hypothetical protein